MLFWGLVGLGYLALLGAGHLLGRYLAGRRGGDGRGGLGPGPAGPDTGPAFAIDWPDDWPELGSAFDRTLLPGAFADEPAPTR